MIPAAELTTAPVTRNLSKAASAHLDLVRGLAACAVAFQHLRTQLLVDWPATSMHSPLTAAVYLLAKFGRPAVIVFFVLSGFLVGSSGVRSVQKREWSFPRYLLHRILRLEIVLLPALLLGLLWDSLGKHTLASPLYTAAWLTGPIDLSWRTLIGNAAFVQGILVPNFGTNAVLWSLANEFWYYVLFGLLVTAALRTTRLWLRVGLAALLLVIAWFAGFRIMILAPLWFLGLGIYMLPRMNLAARGRRVLLVVSTLVFLAFIVIAFSRSTPGLTLAQAIGADLITGILFSFVLYAILHANPARPRYQRFAHGIAAPTYTLYANHLPVLILLEAWIGVRGLPTALHCLELAGWFVVIWLYCYGLYLLFESRTAAIRNWIEPKLFPRDLGLANQ